MTTRSLAPRHPFAPLVLLSWLVPGLGLILLGPSSRKRGIRLMILLHITFFLGILLDGGLVWPVWVPGRVGFNVVSNITFVLQFGAGWMAIVSAIATGLHIPILGATPSAVFHELGSFYCLTAGALNFFVIWQTIDRNKIQPFEKMTG